MNIKSKLTGALFAALTIAAPLALSASPADAKPIQIARNDHDNNAGRDNNNRGHMDAFHDRNHRPPTKVEYRPRQPHGHYKWRNGGWNWRGNQWSWTPGIWIRF